jgi:hypothetical protein
MLGNGVAFEGYKTDYKCMTFIMLTENEILYGTQYSGTGILFKLKCLGLDRGSVPCVPV